MEDSGQHDPSAGEIGVVIPAFNREQTIERAVTSALEQSRPPDQIVVVDDGSTDHTSMRVRQFGSAITLIRTENRGASRARNRGVDALGTPWVAFLDSDDHWRLDHLERMDAAIARTGGGADVYFDDAEAHGLPHGCTLWDLSMFHVGGDFSLIADATEWVMRPIQPAVIPACVIRRDRFVAVGGMHPSLRSREDTHLLFRLGFGHPFCAVSGVGVEVTADDSTGQRLTTASGTGTAAYAACTVFLYRDLLDRFVDLTPEHRRELEARLLDGYLSQVSVAVSERSARGTAPLLRALRLDPRAVARRVIAAAGRSRDRGARVGPEP